MTFSISKKHFLAGAMMLSGALMSMSSSTPDKAHIAFQKQVAHLIAMGASEEEATKMATETFSSTSSRDLMTGHLSTMNRRGAVRDETAKELGFNKLSKTIVSTHGEGSPQMRRAEVSGRLKAKLAARNAKK